MPHKISNLQSLEIETYNIPWESVILFFKCFKGDFSFSFFKDVY